MHSKKVSPPYLTLPPTCHTSVYEDRLVCYAGIKMLQTLISDRILLFNHKPHSHSDI